MDLAACWAAALAFSKQSSATCSNSGSVSTWLGAWVVAGDFVTPALELGRLGSLASSFGVPRDGGRLSSSFGLAFTEIGWDASAGDCNWTARGSWGLMDEAGRGCRAGKTFAVGLGAGVFWRNDGSTNCTGAAVLGGIGAGAGSGAGMGRGAGASWGAGAGARIGAGAGAGAGTGWWKAP